MLILNSALVIPAAEELKHRTALAVDFHQTGKLVGLVTKLN